MSLTRAKSESTREKLVQLTMERSFVPLPSVAEMRHIRALHAPAANLKLLPDFRYLSRLLVLDLSYNEIGSEALTVR
jgi:hypothetical protein